MRYQVAFPHLPNPIHLTLTTLHLDLPSALHPMPTALNDNINSGNLHASLPTDHGSKQRSFLEVVLANDQGDLNTLACHWGVVRRSDHLVGLPTSLRAEPSFGKYHRCSFDDNRHTHKSAGPVLSATSYAAPALGHKYPLHPQSYRPMASQSAMNRVRSFSNLVPPGSQDPLRGKHTCSTRFL